ncbi:MAG: autotransporter-associated beta strand repeat-containing protein, partial [Thermoguttaceae bacterium]|nr:autotransporter-associated beta strand repeat-containing protein [Thermoguttaceae bacterium]
MTSKLQFPNSRPSRILTHGSALFSSLFLMMAGGNVDAQDTVIRYNSSGTQTASGTDIYTIQSTDGGGVGDVLILSGDAVHSKGLNVQGPLTDFTIQSDTPGVKRTIKSGNNTRLYNFNEASGTPAKMTLKDLAYQGADNPVTNAIGLVIHNSTKNCTYDLTIDNVSFTGFINGNYKAGVFGFDEGNLNIAVSNGLIFDGNKVTKSGTYGAAIDMEKSGRLTITGDSVIFSNNFAKAHGGAIHGSNTNITANILKFTGNKAETDYGGAVNLYNGTLTLKGQGEAAKIEFLGNSAGKVGGAIRGNSDLSNAAIRFENNTAGTFGGAIYGDSVAFSGDSTTAVFTGNSAANSGNDLYITGDAGILSFSGSGTYSFDGGIVLEKETAQTAINKAQVTISGRENDDTNHYQLQNVSISNGGRLTVLLDQINTLTGLFSVGADSTLEMNVGDGAEKSFANSITGAGGLTKTGNGKLTLTGTNTYTGKTTISAGTLALSGDAYSNVYALTMDNAGRFEMKSDGTVKLSSLNGAGEVLLSASNTVLELGVGTQAGDSAVFSGHIISSANQKNLTLKKVGAGTQTLNRAGYLYAHLGNSYKEVIVDEGRLIVDAVNSVYTASRTEGFFRAPIIVNEGGTLEYVQMWTTSPNIDLTLNGGTLQLDNAQYLNKLNFNSGTVTRGGDTWNPLRAGYVGSGVWNVTGGNSVI